MPQRVYNPIQSGSVLGSAMSGLKGAIKAPVPFNPFAPTSGDPGDVIPSVWNALATEDQVPDTSTTYPTPPAAPNLKAPGFQGDDFNLPKEPPIDTTFQGNTGPASPPTYDTPSGSKPASSDMIQFNGKVLGDDNVGTAGDIKALMNGQSPPIPPETAPRPWSPGEVPQPYIPSSFDQRNPGIALEGLQRARQKEFGDHAKQLLKTANPQDAFAANAWQGQANEEANDLADPTTPLNKMRGIDAANVAAQQQGFGLPAGQTPTPTQAQGAFARMLASTTAGSPATVAGIDTSSRERIASEAEAGATARTQAALDAATGNPTNKITVGKSGTTISPMSPNQQVPQGAAYTGNQTRLTAAITKQRNLAGPFGAAYAAFEGKSLAQAKADADADVIRFQQAVNPHSTISNMQSEVAGAPPSITQQLQPGQAYTDPTTGETWVKGPDGALKRIR